MVVKVKSVAVRLTSIFTVIFPFNYRYMNILYESLNL